MRHTSWRSSGDNLSLEICCQSLQQQSSIIFSPCRHHSHIPVAHPMPCTAPCCNHTRTTQTVDHCWAACWLTDRSPWDDWECNTATHCITTTTATTEWSLVSVCVKSIDAFSLSLSLADHYHLISIPAATFTSLHSSRKVANSNRQRRREIASIDWLPACLSVWVSLAAVGTSQHTIFSESPLIMSCGCCWWWSTWWRNQLETKWRKSRRKRRNERRKEGEWKFCSCLA